MSQDPTTDDASPRQEVTITLNREVLQKLSTQVSFRTTKDVRDLVADAVNTYVHLGSLHAQGAQFFAREGDEGTLARLRFPFDEAVRASEIQKDEN